MSKNFVDWQDEQYRDDRMFVMNIATAKDENGNNFWHLTTYRNTIQLPIFKNNFFKNEEDLYEYIKGVEPQIPLISRNGQSIELPETVNKKDLNEVWEYFNKWLIENNLFSTVNEISHVPYYVDPRGYTEKIFTSKIEMSENIQMTTRSIHD